ncbi:DUF1073 domain-containing protein [Dyella japonica]|uniref:Phage-related protein (TIGR01555 family) n=1 Tax=Dyella japonica TaxID=231455 RepID=A0ABV2K200_9GAMM
MSKNRQRRHQAAQVQAQAQAGSGKRFIVGDSFANFEARVGIGTNNQSSAGGYGFDFISRNRVQMEAMYRSSWIVGAVVDCIAEDMTRAGIDLNSSLKPEQQTKIIAAFERMHLWDRLCDNTKWARLYGGSLAVMLIDGQKMETPLNVDSIGKGQFKGLLVLDRWLVQPTLNLLIEEYGPDMGMPKFYDVVADSMALKRQRIHHSRVIRMDGVDLPYWQKIAENLWGQSVIERLFDRLLAFDSTTQGAAQLVYKAHLRTVKVKGLREIIAMGGPALDALTKNIDMIRRFQSNEGLTLLDSEDEFDAHQYTFAGLDDVLLQFGQQLSGAAETPLTRLFGQSPAGLNSTGDGEMRQYHESITSKQERRLRPGVTKLLDVVCRSELGIAPPDDFTFEFNSLEQMSDGDKADINQKTTAAVLDAYDAGLISQKTALQELKQSSEVTGIWTNVTDDLINEAEDALPDPTEAAPDDGSTQEPGEGTKPESGDPVRRAA